MPRFGLTAYYTCPDVRQAGYVHLDLEADVPPTQDEAARLLWPAADADIAATVGEGGYRYDFTGPVTIQPLD